MLSYLLYFYVILNSLAKVIYFSDIRKQFITFLIENLSNYHKKYKKRLIFQRNEPFLYEIIPRMRGFRVSLFPFLLER